MKQKAGLLMKITSFLLAAAAVFFEPLERALYQIPRKHRDIASPAVARPDVEAGDGWFVTLEEDFHGHTLPDPWHPSPHGLRNTEYWCPQLIDASQDGSIKILAAQLTGHVCDICPAQGDFTSGIETRKMENGVSIPTFEQAFGYFEARVKLPRGPGLWSAFWIQANSEGRIGAQGKDGSEIDIYESAFYYEPAKVGNALHWDGYNAPFYRCTDHVTDTGTDQYDGWHTYGLLWSPDHYTFFADGKALWQTNAGGVSRVPSYLRLTVEIRRKETGPYGATLGAFANTRETPSVFEIDYVKVWQHKDFLDAVRAPDDFREIRQR